MVREDNVGTIFMASNITTTSCTQHVDIRYKYVNEYPKDRVFENVFIKSADNDSNILIKNLSAGIQKKHSKKMKGEKLKNVPSLKKF